MNTQRATARRRARRKRGRRRTRAATARYLAAIAEALCPRRISFEPLFWANDPNVGLFIHQGAKFEVCDPAVPDGQ